MDVKTCRRCKRLFNYIAGPMICPVCREEIEQQFQVVKKYIDDNRNCDINDVAEACEVDPQQIRQWIREDRLQFSEDSMVGLNCEMCGATIRSGRYCDNCRNKLTNNLNRAFGIDPNKKTDSFGGDQKKGSAKMRFLEQ